MASEGASDRMTRSPPAGPGSPACSGPSRTPSRCSPGTTAGRPTCGTGWRPCTTPPPSCRPSSTSSPACTPRARRRCGSATASASLRPDWFQSADAVGYVAYADLFAGDLQGIRAHIDYLTGLGITYLHLMPLLTPRPGANDGGYAVMDYRSVRPDLGTMADLSELAADLHAAGISLTLDLVLNHVAREHAWAEKAKAGDPQLPRLLLRLPRPHGARRSTRPRCRRSSRPSRPATSPGTTPSTAGSGPRSTNGSGTSTGPTPTSSSSSPTSSASSPTRAPTASASTPSPSPGSAWARTARTSPRCTRSRQALRAAARIMAPRSSSRPRRSSARRTSSPTSARASTPARSATSRTTTRSWSRSGRRSPRATAACSSTALSQFAPIPVTSAWATYLRCHDDIGWAIDDADAAAVGWSGYGHRSFLADFYAGEFDGQLRARHALPVQPRDRRPPHVRQRGEPGGRGGGPRVRRHRGPRHRARPAHLRLRDGLRLRRPAAALHGRRARAAQRPLLPRGDPAKSADNRWMHRPAMDWSLAGHAQPARPAGCSTPSPDSSPHAQALPALHASVATEAVHHRRPGGPRVPAPPCGRHHRAGLQPVGVAPGPVAVAHLAAARAGPLLEHLSAPSWTSSQPVALPPYGAWWLTTT